MTFTLGSTFSSRVQSPFCRKQENTTVVSPSQGLVLNSYLFLLFLSNRIRHGITLTLQVTHILLFCLLNFYELL